MKGNDEFKMTKFWAISKNTFVQTIRQPVYGIIILVTLAILVLTLPLAGWTMSTDYHATDQKMLVNLGLSTLLVSGLLVAAFSASAVLSREIEDKTALTVISKPVSRATFVLSKFAGVAAAVVVAFYLCSLVFLMTVRHRVMPASADPYDWPVIILGVSAASAAIFTALAGNYFFGWSFISAGVWSMVLLLSAAMAALSVIGKEWALVPLGHDTVEELVISGQLLIGITLIFMAVLVFVAVAVAASTRLGQVMTLGVCCAVFLVGSIHSWLFGYWQDEVVAARIMGWVAPKLTYFFPIDALSRDKAIPASYVARTAVYCGLYVAAVLSMGMALFERRQLEAQGASSTMPGAVALLAWTGRVAAIAGAIVALVLVSLRSYHNAAGLAIIAAIAVASAINWAVWSGFGSGGRWAYWLVLACVVVAIPLQAAGLIVPEQFDLDPTGPARVFLAAGAMIAALVILILALPKTRRHFN